MNLDQAREIAKASRSAGRTLPEAFAAFERTGASWVAIMKAVCEAYEVGLRAAREVFDEHYNSLEAFEQRSSSERLDKD